jgi:hypothetical protein
MRVEVTDEDSTVILTFCLDQIWGGGPNRNKDAESPEIGVSLTTPSWVKIRRRRDSTEAGAFSSATKVELVLSESRMR